MAVTMTVEGQASLPHAGRQISKVVFKHVSAAVAAGANVTDFKINGKLLAVMHTGGDAEWQFTLTKGGMVVFSSGNLDNTSKLKSLGLHFDGSQPNAATDVSSDGIPICDETLRCDTANVTTLAPEITVYYEAYGD